MAEITMIRKKYYRTASDKGWKKNPETTKTKTITREFYDNYVGAHSFFSSYGYGASERMYKEYTPIGYVPTHIVTVSPFRKEKIVTDFIIK